MLQADDDGGAGGDDTAQAHDDPAPVSRTAERSRSIATSCRAKRPSMAAKPACISVRMDAHRVQSTDPTAAFRQAAPGACERRAQPFASDNSD
jgi:hypothetical protein